MKSNKFIAVSMREDKFHNGKEIRSCIDNKLLNWIFKLGYYPYLIPNDIKFKNLIKKIEFKGIILSGGNSVKRNKTRTILEYEILNYSKKKNIPVLGICHGMQVMNQFDGGKIKKVQKHVRTKHKLKNLDSNYPIEVNSYHDYSISKLGKNFRIISKSLDDEIEAIFNKKLKWLGWMWHPERDRIFNKKLIRIAKQMFNR